MNDTGLPCEIGQDGLERGAIDRAQYRDERSLFGAYFKPKLDTFLWSEGAEFGEETAVMIETVWARDEGSLGLEILYGWVSGSIKRLAQVGEIGKDEYHIKAFELYSNVVEKIGL